MAVQLQNVPKSVRKIFISAKGYILISGDYKRAEAMFVAYDAEEEKLIELFNDSTRDLYTEVGIDVLGHIIQSHDSSGNRTSESQCFKQVVLASHYGMHARKFVIVCRMNGIDLGDITVRGISSSEKKAAYFLGGYLDRYPNIRRWQKSIISEVSRTRKLHNPLGRLRIFLGRMDDHLHRIALSWRPQSTVGGITNRAMRVLHGLSYIPLIQVHDSLAIEVPDNPESIQKGVLDLESAMTYPIMIHGRTMTIPVDLQCGVSWGELRPYERRGADSREVG